MKTRCIRIQSSLSHCMSSSGGLVRCTITCYLYHLEYLYNFGYTLSYLIGCSMDTSHLICFWWNQKRGGKTPLRSGTWKHVLGNFLELRIVELLPQMKIVGWHVALLNLINRSLDARMNSLCLQETLLQALDQFYSGLTFGRKIFFFYIYFNANIDHNMVISLHSPLLFINQVNIFSFCIFL